MADTLYYLAPLSDGLLKALSARLADLLMPGGLCLLANHFFFAADADSKLSRRIHDAFTWSPRFAALSHHRRAFFLATLLEEQNGLEEPNGLAGQDDAPAQTARRLARVPDAG